MRSFYPLFVFSLSFFTFYLTGCKSSAPLKESQWTGLHFEAVDQGVLPYQKFVPKSKEQKLPLFIFLHGAGERGNDNEVQLQWIAPILSAKNNVKEHPAILVFPQCPAEDYWAPVDVTDGQWTINSSGNPTPVMSRLIELIPQLIEDPRVDKNRVYIGGLSMGSFGTFDLLSRHPEWLAGAIAVCGGGDIKQCPKYQNIPIQIFHGAKDPTVDVQLSRDIYRVLQSLNAPVTYTEYEDGDHLVWNRAFEEPQLLDWLFSQEANLR